jgi:hypothetical protein
VFSERVELISELVKGKPQKPLREPALALFACLLNGYQVYQLSGQLAQLSSQVEADPFMGFLYSYLLGIVVGLIGFAIAFSIILAIGAATIYFLNRRAGGGVVLVISIIGLLVGFVGISMVSLSFNILGLIVSFLSPIFGILAGYWGVKGEKVITREAAEEII